MTPSDNEKAMLEALAEVTLQRKALEAKEKSLRSQLATVLAERGSGSFMCGSYMFEQKLMPGRKTLDKELLSEAGLDLEPYYKVGKPYTTLSIKEVDTV